MRAAAQKIWLKDQNTGLFTSEQREKYRMDVDSSQSPSTTDVVEQQPNQGREMDN